LPLPPAASGDGVLFVNADPWAHVQLGGEDLGDTPLELRLPSGKHRLRLVGGDGAPMEREVEIRAGARVELLVSRTAP
jgi:serine/threonine-protein kinase